MKDSGTPVSLFSFQDIVTSMMGIMVIVILVIVLQLAEARYDYENPKSDNPEYQEIKDKMAELSKRLRQLQETGEEIPENIRPYIDVTEESIDSELASSENAKGIMASEKEKNEKDIASMKLSMEQLRELLKATQEEKKKAKEKRDTVENKMKAAEEDMSIQALERKWQTMLQESERLKLEVDRFLSTVRAA